MVSKSIFYSMHYAYHAYGIQVDILVYIMSIIRMVYKSIFYSMHYEYHTYGNQVDIL